MDTAGPGELEQTIAIIDEVVGTTRIRRQVIAITDEITGEPVRVILRELPLPE